MSYPHFPSKHQLDPLISAHKFFEYLKKMGRIPEGPPPRKVILLYQSSFHERVTKRMKGQFYEKRAFRQLFQLAERPDIAIGEFGVGAPAVVAKLEILIAWGVKEFISIGTAGAIAADLEAGDLVGCNKAIRDEGTSHHYLPAGRYSYPTDGGAFASKFERVGPSWTLDALFRHTKEEIAEYQREGVLTVEMEASALFAVAKVRKVSMGAGFVISDLLHGEDWEPQMYQPQVEGGLEKLLEFALQD